MYSIKSKFNQLSMCVCVSVYDNYKYKFHDQLMINSQIDFKNYNKLQTYLNKTIIYTFNDFLLLNVVCCTITNINTWYTHKLHKSFHINFIIIHFFVHILFRRKFQKHLFVCCIFLCVSLCDSLVCQIRNNKNISH